MDITGIIELVIIIILVVLIIYAFIWGSRHRKTSGDDTEENPFTLVTVYVECTKDKIEESVQSYMDRKFYVAAAYPEPRKVKKGEVTEFTLILKRDAEDIPADEKGAYEEYMKSKSKGRAEDERDNDEEK